MTPSAIILEKQSNEKNDYLYNLENEYKQYYLNKNKDNNSDWKNFEEEVSNSNTKIKVLEDEEDQVYSEYVNNYFKL